MTAYIVKLLVLIPLMSGLIFGALWVYRKYHPSFSTSKNHPLVKVVETTRLNSVAQLIVVEFGDKILLLSVCKSEIRKISQLDVSDA